MKKIIERLKRYRKRRDIKNFKEEHEQWLGGEARVAFSKEDAKILKQKHKKK